MVRSNDTFWNYIEDMHDGSMKCKFCGHLFAKDTSISRIKWHLSGERGHGVAICGQVPKEVQEAAFQAMCGGNKRRKSIACSSNYDVTVTISTSGQEQNHERRPVEMAQGQPVFIGEHTWENDLIGGIELVHNAQETRPITEQASQYIELTRELGIPGELLHAFETMPRTEQVEHLERGSSLEMPLINQVDEPQGDSSANEQSNVIDNMAADVGRIQVGVQGMELGVGEERISSPMEVVNGVENAVEGSNQHVDRRVREEATKIIHLVDQLAGESWGKINEVSTFLMEEKEDVENNSGRLVQPGAGASSSGVLKCNTRETRGLPLPTTKLVGRAFEENMKLIWPWLTDDEVSTIGIYGMGGVGKTTMLQHIYNELLQRKDIIHHVYWVTVSQDFSINKLQNSIARRIGLNLSKEEEELHRAGELSEELKKKQKWILILDDLWNFFELHKVGIPIPLNGCKLIMTTRSERVCQQMDSQHTIKVKPLSKGEAWTLFKEKLGQDMALLPQVERIAVDIVRECAGLPLGIVTMAGSLKGVRGQYAWSNRLKELKESKYMDKKDEVFRLLRFSFDRLDDIAIQQCLLYCALFPEDHKIGRGALINYLIDEEIIKGMGSRQDAFDKGHTMLDKLENVCLLESCLTGDGYSDDDGDNRAVTMHDLIRDMAIRIQQENENNQVIVRAGAQVKDLSDVEEWTENLTRVSLMHNYIEEIPSSYSPRCPNLSTLLLCYNHWLESIEGCFFEQLNGLKVLDLSRTKIEELPAFVSDLVSLTALLLARCVNLSNVPSLRKLRALKRLDLYRTPLETFPQGMECLTSLRYLRMNKCGEMVFPSGILPRLSLLQVFVLEDMNVFSTRIGIKVEGKEVGCLRKLERLACHFEAYPDLVEFFKSRDKSRLLQKYGLFVGTIDGHAFSRIDEVLSYTHKAVCLGNLRIDGDGDFQVMLPKDIQQLIIYKCLCDVSSLINYATELQIIHIWDCNSMECLVSSSWFCSAPLTLGIFSGLKKFECIDCMSMKKLFPPMLLPNLVNLEDISVGNCEKMEEIIGTRSDEEGAMGEEYDDSNTKFSLPKLIRLQLFILPELKSICSVKLICNSLKKIEITECQKLKRMPIFLPLLENGQSSPLPSLESIHVSGCNKMEEIIRTRSDEEGVMDEESNESSTKFSLPELISLKLFNLPELESICTAKLICISLKYIDVKNCQKLKRMPIFLPLLENGQSSPLPSLEGIHMSGCKKMEEIIRTRADEEGVMDEESNESSTKFSLPKLRRLDLRYLPELESICTAKLICISLNKIRIHDCQKLKRMPIFQPLLENGQPSPPLSLTELNIHPKEWWDSVVDWEHPNTKEVLLRFVRFY